MSDPIKLRLAQLKLDETLALSSRVQATFPPRGKPYLRFDLDKAASQLDCDYQKIIVAITALKDEFGIDYDIESYKVILNSLNSNGHALGEAITTIRRVS